MNNIDYFQYYFEESLKKYINEQKLKKYYCKELQEAISYSLLNPGKRIRPMLMFFTALSLTNLPKKEVFKKCLPAAMAIELVHTYSLIHDDLPCMDNDDYRRGKPASHKKFNEALAILAGDALLADSFTMLCLSKHAALLCQKLSLVIGSNGLVSGQVMDIFHKHHNGDINMINEAKTALLFACTCEMAAICMENFDSLELCKNWGLNYGLWFQIKDDINDEESYEQNSLTSYKNKAISAAKKFTYHEYLNMFLS